ncbi:MAG: tetratricopeptide repeat protein, partial [Verrucomicrobiales bacterium]|nr:tetratricopeptide repeat protein [Verrucomicrobiales bacterium]
EEIGRRLLTLRQEMVDHALLADALMEQGRIEESLPHYQSMIDAKPCLPSYSRIAHIRWLRGDLDGAIEMMAQAVACGSYRDPEPMVWCTTRLASYVWQKGEVDEATRICERALQILPDYAQALWLRGRIELGQGQSEKAVVSLRAAANHSLLPEVLWALAEAEELAGSSDDSKRTLAKLKEVGQRGDPRSYAIWLSTSGIETDEALDLAKAEMMARRDTFSWDALAWAQSAAGETVAAQISIRHAMAEGTRDARLLMHAGIIALRVGDAEASGLLNQAQQMRAQLLPSEQHFLDQGLAEVAVKSPRSDPPQVVTK